MTWLLDVVDVADPSTVVQANLEKIENALFRPARPSEVGGVPTASAGAPVAGTFAQYDSWTDANGARWECTASGTPGTWTQRTGLAAVADAAGGATIDTQARTALNALLARIRAAGIILP